MTDDAGLERLAGGFRAFSEESSGEAPEYSALSAAMARDRDVLGFLAELPVGKRHPTLPLAALRFLGGGRVDWLG